MRLTRTDALAVVVEQWNAEVIRHLFPEVAMGRSAEDTARDDESYFVRTSLVCVQQIGVSMRAPTVVTVDQDRIETVLYQWGVGRGPSERWHKNAVATLKHSQFRHGGGRDEIGAGA